MEAAHTPPGHRKTAADFISATINSIRTVLRNPAAMAVWAGLIALFTALGVATAFIGFVAIFPILGYATWHSYRELVSEHEASA